VKVFATEVGLIYIIEKGDIHIGIVGEAFYNDAVLPFYLALRVYPAPMELIMIYQKTVPEPVFQMIVNIMALDVSRLTDGVGTGGGRVLINIKKKFMF
jgi:hypothetical protein